MSLCNYFRSVYKLIFESVIYATKYELSCPKARVRNRRCRHWQQSLRGEAAIEQGEAMVMFYKSYNIRPNNFNLDAITNDFLIIYRVLQVTT